MKYFYRTPILVYHQITPGTPPMKLGEYALSAGQFERQMRYLREHGYTCLSLSELLQSPGYTQSKKTVTITFDDGYKDFFSIAYPILRKYGLTATVFLVADRTHGEYDPEQALYRQYLTWEQVKVLQKDGITFGSHTCSHPLLPRLSHDEIRRELELSKEILEANLNQSIHWIAYPYGESTSEVQSLTEATGYKAAFGVHRGKRSLFNIWRRSCRQNDSLVSFVLKLNPVYFLKGYFRDETTIGKFLRNALYSIEFGVNS